MASAPARKRGRKAAAPAPKPVAEGAPHSDAEFDWLGVPRVTVAFWVRVGALASGPRKGQHRETSLVSSYLGHYLAANVAKAGRRRSR